MNTGQEPLLTGDFAETRTDDLNAPTAWRGLPEFQAVERGPRLILSFDDEAGREVLIEQLGLVIAKKTGSAWSAWWPPRDREDLAALRFDFDAPEQGEPTPEGWRPAPDEEVPDWGDHVGHQVALTYGHDGALLAARCSSCGVDLPPPGSVVECDGSASCPADVHIEGCFNGPGERGMELSPAPEPEPGRADPEPADAPQEQRAAADGTETAEEVDDGAILDPPLDEDFDNRIIRDEPRRPSAYDPFEF